MSLFIELRLDYIAWRAATAGTIRRIDLVRSFGISVPQASLDLRHFMDEHPGVIKYDMTEKRYVATGRKCKREHPSKRLMALE